MITVEIEGKGQVAEFPDGTPQEVIDSAIKRDYFTAKTETKPYAGEDLNTVQKFLAGTGKGMTDVGTGLLQRVLEGGEMIRNATGMPSNQANIDKLTNIVDENRRAFQPLSDVSTAANVGNFVGNVAPAIPVPGGVTGGLLKRMGTSALAGGAIGAAQGTGKDDSAALNTLLGAVAGGGASGVLSAAGKGYNAVRGKLPDNFIEALSKKYGIRTTLGEATNNPIIKKAETWLEGIPYIGIKSFREQQAKQAESAAKDFFAKYTVNPNLSTTAAMKDANDAYLKNLYGLVKENGADLPNVAAEITEQTARSLRERYPSVFDSIQDKNVKKVLNNIIGDVETKTVNTGLLNAKGQAITKQVTPTFSFEDLWMLRKGIGKEMADAKTATAKSELGAIYRSVTDDLDTMFSKNETGQLFKHANDEFKRTNIKFSALRDAYDKAMGTTGAGEAFSPKKFSTALKNLANDPNYKKNVRFTDDEITEMTGLANIMSVVKRAGQHTENPPTGNRWGIPLVAAGSLYASPQILAGEAGTVLLSRFLTTTKAGKNLALAASKVEPNSKAMQIITKMVYNQAPKWAATQASGATRNY